MGTKIVYNHKAIEKKWREKWEEKPVNPRVDENGNKKQKYYCLDMFPYPSGNGLHVGHWRGYVISDVWSRYKLQQGYYIVHPMGWDAFGLPAENYAIKMGVHPAKSTAANVANIKRQINDIAALYDWDMEVNTTDPEFYKWTQWIFVKMFKAGLAYEKEFPINWCPSCKTGLANEEVVNGKCERCGAEVTKKNLRQWMLRITKYADRLLNDLDKLDWPEKVKKMQADWIGKSYGAEVDFPVEGRDEKITVYTTRPDTLHGATFMVLAPEHELAASLATPETKEAVEKYIYDASMKSNVDRMQDKEKTGVFTGSYAINPINGAKVPIWLSDYVLADYGTGAIMCVPAHDDRDFEFATKFNIPIIQVIAKDGKEIENMEEAYTEASGIMINSGDWNGKESSELKEEAPKIIKNLKAAGISKVVMMTGDSDRTAKAIAKRVGVDVYYSEVLPEDKAGFIEKEKAAGRKVIMIGDGINDSPALSAANVGVAISDGAEIAREIADVTIEADHLHGLVALKHISNSLMHRIHNNYRFIVGFNAGLIGAGVLGILQPTTSALLHNTSTLCIGLRSMKNLLPEEEQ